MQTQNELAASMWDSVKVLIRGYIPGIFVEYLCMRYAPAKRDIAKTLYIL